MRPRSCGLALLLGVALLWAPIWNPAARALGSPARAEKLSRQVTVRVEYAYGSAESELEAGRKALEMARQQAREQAFGVSTRAQIISHNHQVVDSLAISFAQAQIIAEKILSASPHRVVEGQVQRIYTLELQAEVVQWSFPSDPSFQVQLSLDRDPPHYRDGDPVALRIRASQDCYITLFAVAADDAVTVLWPNPWRPDTFLRRDQELLFPGPELARQGLRLSAVRLPGLPATQSSVEYLKLIATREPLDLVGRDFQHNLSRVFAGHETGLIYDLFQKLYALPPTVAWTESTQAYTIVP